ncbi:hypothetical protein [Azospirillum brasilense]|uniref:hypothetical protein n=1 Tax=Azospirillum brasilense TaxID=192 RepID=UPI00157B41B7|nr:hypothetical protein [Azospirillum brasilense]
MNDKRIGDTLRLLRFAAGGAIIIAAFAGAVGVNDMWQAIASAAGFGAFLTAKLANLV